MAANREFSPQTLAVLAALCSEASAWRHGYDLAKQTELKSGTLYPILVRLSDRGLVEACWEDVQPAGRPRRHLYRLTSDGFAQAEAALARAHAAAAAAAARGSAAPGSTAPRRTAAAGRRRLAEER
ncbi:MAG: PadR family transcriptional regulator [Streptosporangiaceae bacterium]